MLCTTMITENFSKLHDMNKNILSSEQIILDYVHNSIPGYTTSLNHKKMKYGNYQNKIRQTIINIIAPTKFGKLQSGTSRNQ